MLIRSSIAFLLVNLLVTQVDAAALEEITRNQNPSSSAYGFQDSGATFSLERKRFDRERYMMPEWVSRDGSVKVYTNDSGCVLGASYPMRYSEKAGEEYIEEILKQQNALPNGWVLTEVSDISPDGVFITVKGWYMEHERLALVSIPRSHDDEVLALKSESFFSKISRYFFW